jgi:Icc protein
VRGIVWGHVHQALEGERAGVRLLATPSTCAQFAPGLDDFAIDSRPPAYRMLELLPDGSIVTEVVWVDQGNSRRGTAR